MSDINFDNQFSWLSTSITESTNNRVDKDEEKENNLLFSTSATLFKRIPTNIKLNNKILAFYAYKNMLILALSNGYINIYDAKAVDNIVMIESIDLLLDNDSIYKIFVDQNYNLMLVSLKSKKSILFNLTNMKFYNIPHLNGYMITSFAWMKQFWSNNDQGNTILFGTDKGVIYETTVRAGYDEYVLKNKKSINEDKPILKQLFKVDDKIFIQIKSIFLNLLSIRKRIVHCVMITPKRLYQFIGTINNVPSSSVSILTPLFDNFDIKPNFIEFPNDSNTGDIEIIYDSRKMPLKFIWNIGSKIMYGYFNLDTENLKANAVITHILPLPNDCNDKILSAIPTNYHCVVVYPLRLIAFSLINMSIVTDETLGTYHGQSIGIFKDSETNRCWYITEYRIFYCNTENEDDNVWKTYMNEGMFIEARKHCKDNAQSLKAVNKCEADWNFNNKNYMEAAKLYAIEREFFEEASLKLLSLDDSEPLIFYLNQLLAKLSPNDQTQMALVLNWLFRIQLNILVENSADSNFEQIKSRVYDYIYSLLSNESYMNCVKQYSTLFYQIFQQYTDHELIVTLADKLNDYSYVLSYFIDIDDYTSAIDIIRNYRNPQMIYQYSSRIIRYHPRDMVDIWIDMGNLLDPRKILDTIKYFNCSKYCNIMKEIVRYIEFCIESLKCVDKVVHNHLITLYCSLKDYNSLLKHIISSISIDGTETIPCYDLQFALRLCNSHHQSKCCVYILSVMNLYDEAVDLALKINEIELAKQIAKKPEDDDLKKKLWLKIAEIALSQSKDITISMEFLKESKLLKIEDILQFFDDFTYIDQFRDAICDSLEDYNKEIDTLTKQMGNYMNMSNQLKFFSQNLKKRHIIISINHTCCSCNNILLIKPFYAFPCTHAYHQDCFIKKYYGLADEKNRMILKKLLNRLFSKTTSIYDDSISPTTTSNITPKDKGSRNSTINMINEETFDDLLLKFYHIFIDDKNNNTKFKNPTKNVVNYQQSKLDFDNDIAKQCLMCGEITVEMIDLPLLREKSIMDVN